MSQSAPQEIKPMLSVRGAPVGSEVTLTVVGLPPLARVRRGFGSFGGYESLGGSEADVYGVFTANLRVPYWGERDRVHGAARAQADVLQAVAALVLQGREQARPEDPDAHF